jgi:hypothetical protein
MPCDRDLTNRAHITRARSLLSSKVIAYRRSLHRHFSLSYVKRNHQALHQGYDKRPLSDSKQLKIASAGALGDEAEGYRLSRQRGTFPRYFEAWAGFKTTKYMIIVHVGQSMRCWELLSNT